MPEYLRRHADPLRARQLPAQFGHIAARLARRPGVECVAVSRSASGTQDGVRCILLDLDACAAGYTPMRWQQSLLPALWRPAVEVIHDGIDRQVWRRRMVPQRLGTEVIPEDVRVVTHAARGLEAMRGFDIFFVRVANRIGAAMPNVLFVVVGSDRVHYGDGLRHIEAKTFGEHVLQTERPDLTRFRFLGAIRSGRLVEVLSLSDLHIYFALPFVFWRSLLYALPFECTVLAPDGAPVREANETGRTGMLAGFFDAMPSRPRGCASSRTRPLSDRSPPLGVPSRRCGTASSGRCLNAGGSFRTVPKWLGGDSG